MSARTAETILLVDDEAMVRELVSAMLRNYGYQVLVAEDAERALKYTEAPAGPIHLLLTDVIMPRTSGTELAVRIGVRLKAQQPPLKVLYMANNNDDLGLYYAVVNQGGGLLRKPFTPDVLARKVREVLDAT